MIGLKVDLVESLSVLASIRGGDGVGTVRGRRATIPVRRDVAWWGADVRHQTHHHHAASLVKLELSQWLTKCNRHSFSILYSPLPDTFPLHNVSFPENPRSSYPENCSHRRRHTESGPLAHTSPLSVVLIANIGLVRRSGILHELLDIAKSYPFSRTWWLRCALQCRKIDYSSEVR